MSLLPVGTYIGYISRRGIAGSSHITMSNFLRNHQIDFQSGCTSLQSHQQWRSVPLSPHPRQHLWSPEFFILAILTGVRWNIRDVLICISLMIKDDEHFFMCFSAIRYFSVENTLFTSVFIIARSWKEPRCPSTEEWIQNMWHIYTMEYYSAMTSWNLQTNGWN